MKEDSGRAPVGEPALVASDHAPAGHDPAGFDPARGESVCIDCGGHNPVWFAPNNVWNLIIGGPEALDDPGGLYCPNCFIARAETAGLVPTAWELRPEDVRVGV